MIEKRDDDLVFEIEFNEEQIKKIREETGIDLSKMKNKVKLTGKALKDLITAHNPDAHDQTVGASNS